MVVLSKMATFFYQRVIQLTRSSAVFSHHHHHDGMAQSHLWTELMIDNTDTFLISWAFTVLSITHFQITLFSRMFVVLLCCTFPITSLSHLIAGSVKAYLKISKTETSRSWCFSPYFLFHWITNPVDKMCLYLMLIFFVSKDLNSKWFTEIQPGATWVICLNKVGCKDNVGFMFLYL